STMYIFLDILHLADINIAQEFFFSLPDNIKLTDTAFFLICADQKIFSFKFYMGNDQSTQFFHPHLPWIPVSALPLLPDLRKLPFCGSEVTKAEIPVRRKGKRLP